MRVPPTWEDDEVSELNPMGITTILISNIKGEINVGQRCREIFGFDNVFNIGFLTGTGTGECSDQ